MNLEFKSLNPTHNHFSHLASITIKFSSPLNYSFNSNISHFSFANIQTIESLSLSLLQCSELKQSKLQNNKIPEADTSHELNMAIVIGSHRRKSPLRESFTVVTEFSSSFPMRNSFLFEQLPVLSVTDCCCSALTKKSQRAARFTKEKVKLDACQKPSPSDL